jgi:drug/metabolite transporter (DMT)-like permease
MSKQLLAHVALFLVAVVYGVNYLVAKGLMPDVIGPSGFIMLRVSGAGILFLLLFLLRPEKIDKADVPRLILCGASGVAANQLLFFNGLAITSPVNASIIMTSNPILVLLMSAAILGTQITGRKILGIALGATGAILLLILSNQSNSIHASTLGDLFVLLNAASYGVYLVSVKPLMSKYRPITVVFFVFLFGWLIVLPFGWSQAMDLDWEALSAPQWGSILYVVIATTFVVYLLNIFAIKQVQPTVVSVYIYLQPLMAGTAAVIFATWGLTDYTGDIDLPRILCAVLIFIGVYLVSFPPRKRRLNS